MQLLYFGWVRSKIGISGETVEPPADIGDVRALVEWLQARGKGYSEAFGDLSVVRVEG